MFEKTTGFKNTLTAQSRVFSGTAGSLWTVATPLPLFVHLSPDVVAAGSVVASVEFGKPLSLPVLVQAAAHLVGVVPDHGGVVPDVSAKLEGLDPLVGEELYLIVPVGDGAGPVRGGRALCLLVVVQVLTDAETF